MLRLGRFALSVLRAKSFAARLIGFRSWCEFLLGSSFPSACRILSRVGRGHHGVVLVFEKHPKFKLIEKRIRNDYPSILENLFATSRTHTIQRFSVCGRFVALVLPAESFAARLIAAPPTTGVIKIEAETGNSQINVLQTPPLAFAQCLFALWCSFLLWTPKNR